MISNMVTVMKMIMMITIDDKYDDDADEDGNNDLLHLSPLPPLLLFPFHQSWKAHNPI